MAENCSKCGRDLTAGETFGPGLCASCEEREPDQETAAGEPAIPPASGGQPEPPGSAE